MSLLPLKKLEKRDLINVNEGRMNMIETKKVVGYSNSYLFSLTFIYLIHHLTSMSTFYTGYFVIRESFSKIIKALIFVPFLKM